MEDFFDKLQMLWQTSGLAAIDYKQIIMIVVALALLFLGIARKFEPLLLVGIGFGMLLSNLPNSAVYHPELWLGDIDYGNVLKTGGLIDVLYIGVKTGLYPCLIFIGIGAMTDFGPLISKPYGLLLGAAAQLGIYCAFFLAIATGLFTPAQAASIGIIGGADGPTAIWLTKNLAPELLGPIAVAAYSYMALIPIIQPPIIRALTTKKERLITMDEGRKITKAEKIVFPITITVLSILLLPSVAPLLGCLMFGNLLTECGVTERLSQTAQNGLMNVVTIFLGISVGATATAANFITLKTLTIVGLGLFAFIFSTAGGVLLGKLMCVITKGKINPMIGAAGVSAVPMAARVVNTEGLKENPGNYLLMHAMGPNVAGVIGSAVAAGFLMAIFGG